MDWHFCPHCETQLDDATFICPACRWDPLAPPRETPDEPRGSISDRHPGTAWSPDGGAPSISAHTTTMSRARTVVILGFVLLLGLYGGILVVSDFQAAQDRPAAAGFR